MGDLHFDKFETAATLPTGIRPLTAALLWAGLVSANSAWALQPGDILTIEGGSFFVMEVSPGFFLPTSITGNDGLILGTTQPASGSHSGAPDGTENPGIDAPWGFFGNTGMHQTTSAANVISASGNTATVNFSGWSVTWNTIANIPMGTGAWDNPAAGWSGNVNGVAQITCGVDCGNGDTYTLQYTATVPVGDPSNFGGVHYGIKLTGRVLVPSAPTSAPPGISAAQTNGLTTIRVDESTLLGAGIPPDTGFSHVGGYYDFRTPTSGGATQVVLPLTSALPAGFVYRKYNPTTNAWASFVEDAGNSISSASVATGAPCPAPGDLAYTTPASAGHNCLQLTITDGGPNDADGATNSSVTDPGGVATPAGVAAATPPSGSSGCSLSAHPVNPLDRGDWWLLLGFVAWLGFVARRKRA